LNSLTGAALKLNFINVSVETRLRRETIPIQLIELSILCVQPLGSA
jgi:hypothetical protein